MLATDVLEDLRTIWNCVLTEKLHINPRDRGLYSAILVLGKTFDNLACRVGSLSKIRFNSLIHTTVNLRPLQASGILACILVARILGTCSLVPVRSVNKSMVLICTCIVEIMLLMYQNVFFLLTKNV
ncbi:hypothetical protein BDA96_07G119900 [Sorghum bicolor]|uniref:Uncharacterized protein n=2 Tax=Sorghum bicolor TaxID=4558 RepID=A0A1Z5R985_SORBI|nr:hypothetical protein BDA96_07G119900 [Sorghum bicolor]OQU80333.1 hypothetical protein SORBI_3007G112766 [Sorghum bicolor]